MGDIAGVLIIARETKQNEFIKNFHITRAEMKIIHEILSGYSNSEIAQRLSISELTVKSHITHIYNKLNINNRIQLLECLKNYYISP